MFRKIILSILAIVLCFSVAACGKQAPAETPAPAIKEETAPTPEVTEKPTADKPAATTTQKPAETKPETPKTETPKADPPKVEEPKTDTPKVEEPKPETPAPTETPVQPEEKVETPVVTPEPVHNHNWVEVTETSIVHHEASGHYEDVIVGVETHYTQVVNCVCGAQFSSQSEFVAHKESYPVPYVGHNRFNTVESVSGSTPIYENQWIEDSPERDETIIKVVGHKCSTCGETK